LRWSFVTNQKLNSFLSTGKLQLGLCALFMAAEMGDVPTVEVLLSFQPDLSVREKVRAITYTKQEALFLFLYFRLTVAVAKGGATILHAAASSGHVGIMEALLDRGLSPTATDSVCYAALRPPHCVDDSPDSQNRVKITGGRHSSALDSQQRIRGCSTSSAGPWGGPEREELGG
jgi:ankyrin repeat protein